MTSTVYNKYQHTHVLINVPAGFCRDGFNQPMAIVLHTGKHVWVEGCYAMKHHPDIKQVGDGRDNAFDEDGNCILSVPESWCWFMDEAEAESVMHCIEADQRLLGYAQ